MSGGFFASGGAASFPLTAPDGAEGVIQGPTDDQLTIKSRGGQNLVLSDDNAGGGIEIACDDVVIGAAGGQLVVSSGFYHNTSDTDRFELSGVPIMQGAGSPEGVITASRGAIYRRTDGGASTTLYVKESGSGNTGWVAK